MYLKQDRNDFVTIQYSRLHNNTIIDQLNNIKFVEIIKSAKFYLLIRFKKIICI